jgi:hypothetical protein
MKKIPFYLLSIVFAGICITINSCKKKDTFQSDQLADYMQLQVGKYVTYRLDSLKFINFGDTLISYLAKDVVDDSITDGSGRPSWRVIRYLSDTTGTAPWTPTEDNLRYQKLKLPIVNDFSWKGNAYIDTRSVSSQVPYLYDWDYTYANVGTPYTVLGGTIPITLTVNQRRDSTNTADTVYTYFERNYSMEVYGKGIGLIYKYFLHSEFQGPNDNSSVGTTTGYGITLNMVDHN